MYPLALARSMATRTDDMSTEDVVFVVTNPITMSSIAWSDTEHKMAANRKTQTREDRFLYIMVTIQNHNSYISCIIQPQSLFGRRFPIVYMGQNDRSKNECRTLKTKNYEVKCQLKWDLDWSPSSFPQNLIGRHHLSLRTWLATTIYPSEFDWPPPYSSELDWSSSSIPQKMIGYHHLSFKTWLATIIYPSEFDWPPPSIPQNLIGHHHLSLRIWLATIIYPSELDWSPSSIPQILIGHHHLSLRTWLVTLIYPSEFDWPPPSFPQNLIGHHHLSLRTWCDVPSREVSSTHPCWCHPLGTSHFCYSLRLRRTFSSMMTTFCGISELRCVDIDDWPRSLAMSYPIQLVGWLERDRLTFSRRRSSALACSLKCLYIILYTKKVAKFSISSMYYIQRGLTRFTVHTFESLKHGIPYLMVMPDYASLRHEFRVSTGRRQI